MKNKAIDFYLNFALIIDATIVILMWILNSFVIVIDFNRGTKANNLSILSDIISASISLAGFILASLTIIVAIKANLSNKSPELAKNPLELFFSSDNYKKIIEIFQGSIIELTLTFVSAYICWISLENIDDDFLFKVNVSLVFLVSISVVRSLLVLFKIINIKE
jgi:hypothetical protein